MGNDRRRSLRSVARIWWRSWSAHAAGMHLTQTRGEHLVPLPVGWSRAERGRGCGRESLIKQASAAIRGFAKDFGFTMIM